MGIARIADGQRLERPGRDGRERLLSGARALLAERGYAAMELRDVAERGRAPRGSIYHHFPDGKRELAVAAVEAEGREVRATIERWLAERGVRGTIAAFGASFRKRFADRPDVIGCPVAMAALAQPDDPELRVAASAAFRTWEEPIAEALVAEGVERRQAESFAGFAVSATEGAIIRSRAAADPAVLKATADGLNRALDSLLEA